jgi:hypothetical protein
LRRVCVLAVALFAILVVPGAGAALGDPPRQCKDYEYVSNYTCLIQSRAATFTLSPHEVRVGDTITATLTNVGAYDLVRVIWSTLEPDYLTPVSGNCGDVRLGKGQSSSCKFKVTRPTAGWRTVICNFGTTIGPAQSRDYFGASLSSTPPPTTTQEEKKASLSVSIKVAGQLGTGDTADGKVTVRAVDGPVHGIRFNGDPVRVAEKQLKLVESPKAPAPFSLSAGGSRTFAFAVKGVSKGTATLRSAAQGTGPDGDPVSGAAAVPVKVGESALQVTLDTAPDTLALAVDDDGKVKPGLVNVEVKLKNTTGKAMNNVSLTGLFPQPVDEGSTPDQLAFDDKLLPVRVGTLGPGATFKRAFPLRVTSDGEYQVRAVAQYAESAKSPTQVATGIGGRFEITVPLLWFEARLEQSGLQKPPANAAGDEAGGAWVKAGGTALITGKVRNLSSYRTLCLSPLGVEATGNAGGTGPVDIVRFDRRDMIAPPAAGPIKPRDDILIGLWVHTVEDGSPRATIEFAPKAGTIEPNGECLATRPPANALTPAQIRIKEGSQTFELHVDVRDPVFSPTLGRVLAEYYGGLMYGAAKGSADFFGATFASVAEILSPANLAKQALDPLGIVRGWATAIKTAEYLAHYWETAPPDARKNLFARIASVFTRAGADTWKDARENVDSVVGPWMDSVVGAYYRGDYATVAKRLGEAHGYVGQQVTLNIAVGEIGNAMLAELPRVSAAFKEIGDTTRTFKTLRALPPGKLVNLRELQSLYGIAAEDLRKMAAIAEKYGVRIGVKGRSAEAIAELKRGAVWKPEPVKPKNVNSIDRDWLGFKTRKGIVATKKFTPAEVQKIRERVASSNLSFEQKQAIIERLGVRLGEEKYLAELKQFRARGEIEVGKNYRDNGLSPEDAPFVSERRKFGLETTPGSPGEFNPKMAKAGSDKLEFITGDVDGLYLIAARGHALSAAKHLEILKELWKTGWQHPETLTWIRNGEFEFAAKGKILGEHALGGEAALEIGPDGIARAVFIDLGKSLLFDQRAFWLDVVGGYVAR